MHNPLDRIKGILENKDLKLPVTKLAAVATIVYNPTTFLNLKEILGMDGETGDGLVNNIVAILEEKKVAIRVAQKGGKDFKVFPTFGFSTKKSKGEKVVEFPPALLEGDVELFMKVMEEVLEEKPPIKEKLGKKDMKKVRSAVSFINGVIDNLSVTKREAYRDYITIALKPFGKFWKPSVRCLDYPYNKKTWKGRVEKPTFSVQSQFCPAILDYLNPGDMRKFYGIDVSTIPKDVKESPFYTTVWVFLLSKPKSHPICTEVLHSLERVIVYSLYREEDTTSLVELHKEYKKKYLEAKEKGTLDNLADFVKRNKPEKKEEVCQPTLQ